MHELVLIRTKQKKSRERRRSLFYTMGAKFTFDGDFYNETVWSGIYGMVQSVFLPS